MSNNTDDDVRLSLTRRQVLTMGAVGGAGLLLPLGLYSRLADAKPDLTTLESIGSVSLILHFSKRC